MNSIDILNFALAKLKENHYLISNVAVDIVLEKPKLSPYKEQLKKALSKLINLPNDRIAVHANTSEKVGPVGEGKAIEVYCQTLIYKN